MKIKKFGKKMKIKLDKRCTMSRSGNKIKSFPTLIPTLHCETIYQNKHMRTFSWLNTNSRLLLNVYEYRILIFS